MEPAGRGRLGPRMDREAAVKLIESRHTFPSSPSFHVIVRADEADIEAVSAALAAQCGLPDLAGCCVRVPSRNGTYVSLRLALPCADAGAMLDIYALLARQERVVRYF